MFGLDKNTVENVAILFASVLIFNTLPKFQFVGKYIQQYPLILFGVAILIIVFKDKIANAIGG